MNLTDLQVELRSIEHRISSLQAEIEKMKPQPEDEQKRLFDHITEMAAQYPLGQRNYPAIFTDELKHTYITCLAYITVVDENKIHEKLLYLCRLAFGMDMTVTAEMIIQMGMAVEKAYFTKACLELKEVKYPFLTEALILANLTEEASEATFSLIADIAKIFECDKEELRVAAYVARGVLTADMSILQQLPVPSKNRFMGKFREHIPNVWIQKQRRKCGAICVEKKAIQGPYIRLLTKNAAESTRLCKVKDRVQAGTVVKKGDVLISYFYEEKSPVEEVEESFAELLSLRIKRTKQDIITAEKEKNLIAPCDGVVFFVEGEEHDSSKGETRNMIFVYVVSYFDDYAEFCQWHEKRVK